jgi:hypothetical protein
VNALITVEGQHSEAMADVTTATNHLLALFSEHQPRAKVTSTVLTPESSQFPT